MARGVQLRPAMDQTAEDLKVRTKRFAIAVLDFIETLPFSSIFFSVKGANCVPSSQRRA